MARIEAGGIDDFPYVAGSVLVVIHFGGQVVHVREDLAWFLVGDIKPLAPAVGIVDLVDALDFYVECQLCTRKENIPAGLVEIPVCVEERPECIVLLSLDRHGDQEVLVVVEKRRAELVPMESRLGWGVVNQAAVARAVVERPLVVFLVFLNKGDGQLFILDAVKDQLDGTQGLEFAMGKRGQEAGVKELAQFILGDAPAIKMVRNAGQVRFGNKDLFHDDAPVAQVSFRPRDACPGRGSRHFSRGLNSEGAIECVGRWKAFLIGLLRLVPR